MGRYAESAQRIVNDVLARRASSDDKRYNELAEEVVGDLQEFAEEVNTALRVHRLDRDLKVRACSWEKQGTNLISRLSVSSYDCGEDIVIIVPTTGGRVTVAGRPVKYGDDPIEAICREVIRWLT